MLFRGIDRNIGRILSEIRREGVYKDTVFVVTSGRAFGRVRYIVSRRSLANAIAAAGGQTNYIVGDGAALIGLRDTLQAQPVAQALEANGTSGIDAIYYRSGASSAPAYAAQFLNPSVSASFARASSHILSTLASPHSPDVVVVYRPFTALRGGEVSTRAPSWLGIQWHNQSIPLIIAGHGVYAGRVSRYPARLVDIAPTIEAALGLDPSGDGVTLADAVYGVPVSSSGERSRSLATGKDVVALQQRESRFRGARE